MIMPTMILVVGLGTLTAAAVVPIQPITFDENGNGTWWEGSHLSWALLYDYGPGAAPKSRKTERSGG